MTKKRKSHHRSGKSVPRDPGLRAGEHRRSIVEGRGYVRVTLEYQTHSQEMDDTGRVGQSIAAEMYGAARVADLRILAAQRPNDIVDGEILTPDGRMVLTKWIPAEGELLILQARQATVEDLATLDRYAEPPEETEARKAEARRILDERAAVAATEAVAGPSILEQAAPAAAT